MKLEEIELKIPTIPISELGEIQDDHEIWEVDDEGAHFKLTRHQVLDEISGKFVEFISLSVSGAENERSRIRDEFSQVMGKIPDTSDSMAVPEHTIDFFLWLV